MRVALRRILLGPWQRLVLRDIHPSCEPVHLLCFVVTDCAAISYDCIDRYLAYHFGPTGLSYKSWNARVVCSLGTEIVGISPGMIVVAAGATPSEYAAFALKQLHIADAHSRSCVVAARTESRYQTPIAPLICSRSGQSDCAAHLYPVTSRRGSGLSIKARLKGVSRPTSKIGLLRGDVCLWCNV